MESLTKMRMVPDSLLEQRIDEVQSLSEDDEKHEYYRIVKDLQTGEHYLHYAYMHWDVGRAEQPEWFHQFMPLDADEVLALALGEQAYTYPEHWPRAFLRNGPPGQYVWFEQDVIEEEEKYEKLAKDIQQVLLRYKKQGKMDEATIEKMWKDIDALNS